MSGLLKNYLGVGVIADRPVTPDTAPDTLVFWYATDTSTLSGWDGAAWDDIAGGGTGGTVDSVVAGTNIDVDATDPANPEVSLDAAGVASLALADTAVQPADLADVATTGEAVDVTYDNVVSGLTATDVQGAIDEIAAGSGGGTVDTIVAGTNIDVDATDPANPEVSLDAAGVASLALADSAVQPADLAAVATSGEAADVSIVDTGGFFTSTDVEGALQELGAGSAGDVVGPAVAVDDSIATYDGTTGKLIQDGGKTINQVRTESWVIACSDETTNLTTGTGKVVFRTPYAFTVTEVRASVGVAQTAGSILTFDINESGVSILSTKLTIDNSEKTSTTAATPPVISDASLANDAEITIDIDQVGTALAKGLKITIIGYPT